MLSYRQKRCFWNLCKDADKKRLFCSNMSTLLSMIVGVYSVYLYFHFAGFNQLQSRVLKWSCGHRFHSFRRRISTSYQVQCRFVLYCCLSFFHLLMTESTLTCSPMNQNSKISVCVVINVNNRCQETSFNGVNNSKFYLCSLTSL